MLVIEQFAVVAMIPALVLAVLGWPRHDVLIFPLAFLFFVVPFGRALVPYLMQVTADIATVALQWTGVPVLRSHMYISIPSGEFEVARACSGLNYFITGLVLGVLYAYLSYRGWRKRSLCVAAFLVVPIVAERPARVLHDPGVAPDRHALRARDGARHVRARLLHRRHAGDVLDRPALARRRWHAAGGHVDAVAAPDRAHRRLGACARWRCLLVAAGPLRTCAVGRWRSAQRLADAQPTGDAARGAARMAGSGGRRRARWRPPVPGGGSSSAQGVYRAADRRGRSTCSSRCTGSAPRAAPR